MISTRRSFTFESLCAFWAIPRPPKSPAVFDSRRGRLPAWLSVIARHRAIDSLRSRRPEREWCERISSAISDPIADTEQRIAMEKARETLSKMPFSQRLALEMAFFEGLTHKEIAHKIGDPLGTVKARIRNGLLVLRQALST